MKKMKYKIQISPLNPPEDISEQALKGTLRHPFRGWASSFSLFLPLIPKGKSEKSIWLPLGLGCQQIDFYKDSDTKKP